MLISAKTQRFFRRIVRRQFPGITRANSESSHDLITGNCLKFLEEHKLAISHFSPFSQNNDKNQLKIVWMSKYDYSDSVDDGEYNSFFECVHFAQSYLQRVSCLIYCLFFLQNFLQTAAIPRYEFENHLQFLSVVMQFSRRYWWQIEVQITISSNTVAHVCSSNPAASRPRSTTTSAASLSTSARAPAKAAGSAAARGISVFVHFLCFNFDRFLVQHQRRKVVRWTSKQQVRSVLQRVV